MKPPQAIHQDLIGHNVVVLWGTNRVTEGTLTSAHETNVVISYEEGWTSVPYKRVYELAHATPCQRCSSHWRWP